MKVCLLGPATYAGKFQFGQWPVASEQCDPETAARSYAAQLELFEHAEALGFDWVSVSEHHYSPGLMAPSDDEADEIVERAREAIARRLGLAPGAAPHGGDGGAPGVAGFQFHRTPQTILEQARAYREAGVGVLDIAFAPDAYGRGADATKEALTAFGEVLTDVQAL